MAVAATVAQFTDSRIRLAGAAVGAAGSGFAFSEVTGRES
jgi:hypothetical protein